MDERTGRGPRKKTSRHLDSETCAESGKPAVSLPVDLDRSGRASPSADRSRGDFRAGHPEGCRCRARCCPDCCFAFTAMRPGPTSPSPKTTFMDGCTYCSLFMQPITS